MYNLSQLTNYSKKFLKDTYDMDLEIPITLNGRLKKCCGRFIAVRSRATGESYAKVIEMNKFFVENNDAVTILDVLRHELIHYALFAQGKPYKDGHPIFERELKRLGVVSQSTIDKYQIISKPIKVSVYECESCGNTYRTKRALQHDGKYHRCRCSGELISKGKQLIRA